MTIIAYFAKKSYIDSNPQIVQGFTNAVYKGLTWTKEHTSKEIAEVIQKFFPDTDLEMLANAIEQYKNIVEQAVEISSNVAANPEKFNDKFWQFQTLMENLYGKKVYINHSTKGQDGIFVLFTEYVDLKRDVMKNGGYEHQSRRLNSVTDELKAKLNKVEEYIKTNFAA